MKINTMIVDDEPLARDRVKRFLRDEHDIRVIGECGNGKEAVAAIKEHKPDLVFLDIQMPERTVRGGKGTGRKKRCRRYILTAYDNMPCRL